MDIYNAVGFVTFGALDITLYYNIVHWFRAIKRPWPWLAVAKLAAAAALLLGVRHSIDVTWTRLLCAWLGGGLVVAGWQGINFASVPNVDWVAKLNTAFMLGSFFSAFGWLGVKATLAPDLVTAVAALGQAALAAVASMVAVIIYGIIHDAIVNAARS